MHAAFIERFRAGNSSRNKVRPLRHGTAPITVLNIWASIATPWHADVTAFGTPTAVAMADAALALTDEAAAVVDAASIAAAGREHTRASARLALPP